MVLLRRRHDLARLPGRPRLMLVAPLVALAACVPTAQAVDPAATRSTVQGTTSVPAGGCRVVDGRADGRCTPGAINLLVTQDNLAQTICRSGWTATVRPPVSYTDRLKAQQMRAYGEPGPPSGYEEDHLIPLETGGSLTDPGNLWPEPRSGTHSAAVKDQEETSLKRAVCGGRMSLADARAQILRDWRH